jgi:hypothetical protein
VERFQQLTGAGARKKMLAFMTMVQSISLAAQVGVASRDSTGTPQDFYSESDNPVQDYLSMLTNQEVIAIKKGNHRVWSFFHT